MALRRIDDLAEVDKVNKSCETEDECIKALSDIYVCRPSSLDDLPSDPFTPAYRDRVTAWLGEITALDGYDPAENELSPYLEDALNAERVVPGMYSYTSSAFVGALLQAYGAVLAALDVHKGDAVLEYGAGDGQLCLNLAKMGCRATAVDIELRYLRLIEAQAKDAGIQVHTLNAPFGASEPGEFYDRILFFEAFHHWMAHRDELWALRDLLKPKGKIVFAGEPIMDLASHYRPAIPYAWGPRLDGLSLRAMQTYGWCELGFQQEYFIDLLMRSGFTTTFQPYPGTARGDAYIATPVSSSLSLGDKFLLDSVATPGAWGDGEGELRWTVANQAAIPLWEKSGAHRVSIELFNYLPTTKQIVIRSGSHSISKSLEFGRVFTAEIDVDGPYLVLETETHRPCDLNPDTSDTRQLGIGAGTLTYLF